MLRSTIRIFGGKGNLVRWLLKYIPKHRYYLELFGGGASLLFAKPPCEFEVYNDIDGLLVNFFRVIRDSKKFKKFLKMAWLTPVSRNEHISFRDKILKDPDSLSDIEKAFYFWYVSRTCFGGNIFGGGFGIEIKDVCNNMPKNVSSYISALEMLPFAHRRIMKCVIENLDFRECMERYVDMWSYDNAFVYCDPPYVEDTREDKGLQYIHEMSKKDHEDFVDILLRYSNKAKFMVSGYDNEIYKKLEKAGWKKLTKLTACHVVGKTRFTKLKGDGVMLERHPRVECIWVNYDVCNTNVKQLKLFC